MARAAQGQATTAANTAGTTAAQYGADASGINANLNPFLTSELNNPQGYSQQQQTSMISAAQGGAGGATSGVTGQANLEAARTRNGAGFGSALDAAAHARTQAAAGSSEGIAANNAQLQQQNQQAAAHGLQGLYGTNTDAMAQALGQQNNDINTELKAGQSGWLQNATGVLGALKGASGKGWTI